jgi:MFS family permease
MSDRFGRRRPLMAGLALYFLASVGLAMHGQEAGTASALMGALQFGLATLAGAWVGTWHDGTARFLMVIMALCGGGSLANAPVAGGAAGRAWAHNLLRVRPDLPHC